MIQRTPRIPARLMHLADEAARCSNTYGPFRNIERLLLLLCRLQITPSRRDNLWWNTKLLQADATL